MVLRDRSKVTANTIYMHENMATQDKMNQQNSHNCWQYKPGQQKLCMAECHTLHRDLGAMLGVQQREEPQHSPIPQLHWSRELGLTHSRSPGTSAIVPCLLLHCTTSNPWSSTILQHCWVILLPGLPTGCHRLCGKSLDHHECSNRTKSKHLANKSFFQCHITEVSSTYEE